MEGYLAFYILAIFTLTRRFHGESINVCLQPIKSIGYNGYRKVSFSWTLTNQNCESQNEVLLLKLAKINLKRSGLYQCRGYLKISAYRESKNICEYSENTCFVVIPENSTWFDASIADDCTNIKLIRMENIFPSTVTYVSKSWANTYLQHFEIGIIYQSSNSKVDKTTTVQQMSTTAQHISTTVQQMSTTAQHISTHVQQMSTTAQQSTVLFIISEQVQAAFIDRTLAFIFGVLLFIVLIVLFAVIVRLVLRFTCLVWTII
ncbi:uncharacterized protein LOC120331433 isoform X2 [Styela clava]|uniref:uncharacterized protein LOC120331433 isoform X2 n=1 Tax=Styela clava TaxID=7725 RepID=UPI00193ABD7B|nr:uncharacterized protein LOC120331433 isoform X2 [Styela clava]